MQVLSIIGGPQVATPEITLMLSARQADTLEDAILTFAPSVAATIHPTMTKGERALYDAHIVPDQLPQAVSALTQYRQHIAPESKAISDLIRMVTVTSSLMALVSELQGVPPT